MEYSVSWLGTLAVMVIGIVLGVVSSLFIQARRPVLVWSFTVAGIFAVAAMISVVVGYSWMFTNETRALFQEIAIAAAVTGLTFASRSAG
jgi:hypothetical protein